VQHGLVLYGLNKVKDDIFNKCLKEESIMICSNCYADIPDGAYNCPKCGTPILQPEPDTKNGIEPDLHLL
jgi:ribosomal protein L40E